MTYHTLLNRPMGAPAATIRIAQNPDDRLWYVQNGEGAWCLLPIAPDTATYVAEAMCAANILGDPVISTVRWPDEVTLGLPVEAMTMVTRRVSDA